MGSRFVQPESRKLDLSDGDWLIVRKRLTYGERRAAYLRTYELAGDTFVSHPAKLGLSMVVAYLLDWSLTDATGAQVVVRNQPPDVVEQIVASLDVDDFAEIRAAVEAHENAMVAERDAQKKTRAGSIAAAPTSALHSAVAGDSTSTLSADSILMTATS